VTGLTAAAFVTGVVWVIAMLVAYYWSNFEPTGSAESGNVELEVAVGVGLWLLVAAAVVALGAAVLLMGASRRGARPAGPQVAWQSIQERAEPVTPRYGFPVPADAAPPPDPSAAGAVHSQWARPVEQQPGVAPPQSVPDTPAPPPAEESGPGEDPQAESGHVDGGDQRPDSRST
jgi:hypothetical protein